MFQQLKNKFLSSYTVQNYRKILPYVKPYWKRALLAVLITVPIGAMDAIIAWSLKPYMDVVMLEQQATAIQTAIIPLLIIAKHLQLYSHLYEYVGGTKNISGCQNRFV